MILNRSITRLLPRWGRPVHIRTSPWSRFPPSAQPQRPRRVSCGSRPQGMWRCDLVAYRCGFSGPVLQLGKQITAGAALLRMLAAIPLVQPIENSQSPVQCVGMPDLCRVVSWAVAGDLPQRTYDLVEDVPASFSEVLAETRRRMGFPPARAIINVPTTITALLIRCADTLGHLGWRSPLRCNAMTDVARGVVGDPEP